LEYFKTESVGHACDVAGDGSVEAVLRYEPPAVQGIKEINEPPAVQGANIFNLRVAERI